LVQEKASANIVRLHNRIGKIGQLQIMRLAHSRNRPQVRFLWSLANPDQLDNISMMLSGGKLGAGIGQFTSY